MGYYASGEGHVVAKAENDVQEIKSILEEYDLLDSYRSPFDSPVEIGIVFEYSKYYDEDIYEVLELIAGKVKEGEIRFVGDDDCQWKFKFKDGRWEEKNGEVLFDNKDMWAVMKNGKIMAAFSSYEEAAYYAESSDMEVYETRFWF